MSFSATFLSTLVHAALALTGVGVLVLLTLLARDIKENNLW